MLSRRSSRGWPLQVFSQLSVYQVTLSEQVCTEWRKMASIGSLWETLAAASGHNHIKSKGLLIANRIEKTEKDLTMEQRLENHLMRGCCRCLVSTSLMGAAAPPMRKAAAQFMAYLCPSCKYINAKQWGMVDPVASDVTSVYQMELNLVLEQRKTLISCCVGQSCFKPSCIKCAKIRQMAGHN